MRKYHFDVNIDTKRGNNAGSKATSDCRKILIETGFVDLQISVRYRWYLMPVHLVIVVFKLLLFAVIISKNSLIVVQYPLLGINRFFKYFIRLLKKKGCRFCALIHDVDSLRSEPNEQKTLNEIKALSAYDAVISHNAAMTKWLLQNNYQGHVEEIGLFDYLASGESHSEPAVEKEYNEVAFAGALDRGSFLEKLAACNYPFYINLYGNGFKKSISNINARVRWFGSFSPQQIIHHVRGDFGLIWDGNSVEEITGLAGQYMRYNTPHKTSLYVAAGLPVIVSKNAAVAAFVKRNNIGVCVDSLREISSKVLGINPTEYTAMKQNVLAIGEQV
ncbi:MAG: hypothetical protein M3040_10035, partial [Bacteroidota bacterium]|nr:hypothetical protein [Bacteroidota bacterium]